jgi:anti-sigma factor RsiW
MKPDPRQLSDLMLEKYLADALDAKSRKHVEDVVAKSPADAARLEALRADSADFLRRYPPESMVARYEAQASVHTRRVSLVAALARKALQAAGQPEAAYLSDEFVALCLRSRMDTVHAPQHPAFTGPGDDFIVEHIVALDDIVATVLSEPQHGEHLVHLVHPESAPSPAPTEPAMVALVARLRGLVENHPDVPKTLKPHLVSVIKELKSQRASGSR